MLNYETGQLILDIREKCCYSKKEKLEKYIHLNTQERGKSYASI